MKSRRTDAEAEAPILWPTDVKESRLIGKDWRNEAKGMTEDEIVGWHHEYNGYEFEQTPGDSEGQASLECCSPWGCRVRHDLATKHQQWLFVEDHFQKSVLNIHWKDWCWSWNSNTLATLCEELTHWKRHWCWKRPWCSERLKARGEVNNRGWSDWIAVPIQWTWIWANSRR